jgi:hypothetical protein
MERQHDLATSNPFPATEIPISTSTRLDLAKGHTEATRSILIHLDLVNEAATPKVIPRIRINSDWEKGILPGTISDWENDLTGTHIHS